jgi:outer membrane protein OmpA-like peptidoglycan-associated protein
MQTKSSFWKTATVVGMMAILVGVSSGCVATRKFTRARVDEKAQELTARIDTNQQSIETHERSIENNTNQLNAHTGQIEELGTVTRTHSGQIATLDGEVDQVDQKTQHALSVGEGAQRTADGAVGQVSTLNVKFDNRNNYTVMSEEKILFGFDSAAIEKSYMPVLDQIASQLKEDADAIVVMEGRTDATGDNAYNIRLGERRLEAVIRYLVVQQDVPMHKVHRMSFGEDRAFNENKTREERAENRAVVLRVMGPNLNTAGGGVAYSGTSR